MKISIERNSLLNSLSHVQNVVEKRNTIPILSNILINAKANTKIFNHAHSRFIMELVFIARDDK